MRPDAAATTVGQSVRLAATVYDAARSPLPQQAVSWSTTNDAIVAVSPTGDAVGRRPGIAWVFAVAGEAIGSAEITVNDSVPGADSVPAASSGSVTPPALTLAIGSARQLTATVRNLLGVIIGGLATAWTTSNAAVATVSPNGVVTAVAPGTVTITANTQGSIAASVVTVVASDSVASPWPHAPSSYTLLSDDGFDYLTPLAWTLTEQPVGMVSTALDTTAPDSPPAVLQFTYPTGFVGGRAPGTEHHALGGARQVFAGMSWKTNAGWQGHNSNVNKLAFVFVDHSGGGAVLMFYGSPGGPYELRVALELKAADTRFWLLPNVAHVPVSMGEWHRTEWQLEYNSTTSPANGTIRWWLDGTLVGEYTDVLFPVAGLDEFQISPTWGGRYDAKASADALWVDHLFLSAK